MSKKKSGNRPFVTMPRVPRQRYSVSVMSNGGLHAFGNYDVTTEGGIPDATRLAMASARREGCQRPFVSRVRPTGPLMRDAV